MKLTRDPHNAKIAGVCAGIARASNFDVTAVRIIFTLMVPFGLGGIFLYAVLWAILPESTEEPGSPAAAQWQQAPRPYSEQAAQQPLYYQSDRYGYPATPPTAQPPTAQPPATEPAHPSTTGFPIPPAPQVGHPSDDSDDETLKPIYGE